MNHNWPWVALAVLGVYHGLNPAMGWLFALALGLQEKRRSAVVGALLPIALGHAAAITAAILALRFVQHLLPMNIVKWGVVLFLLTLGVYRLFRASHPRGAGMRVGGRDLFAWSFLMASAHGAGLMVVPVLMRSPMSPMTHAMFLADSPGMNMTTTLYVVLVHTVAMLFAAAVLAIGFFEFYEDVGLKLLKQVWLNFDLLWAVALLVAAISLLLF
ncbi:MAG TPA: hypothetical protein VN777_05815 [Terriglobales bacterium]|nr:hypothetical protein [Terriglobales bacterium]